MDLYLGFLDLKGAYDSVPRKQLFHALINELGVDQAVVK
jgi:hypothetical protein